MKIIVRFRPDFVLAARQAHGLDGGYEAFVEGLPGTWEAGVTDSDAINKLILTYLTTEHVDISGYEVVEG